MVILANQDGHNIRTSDAYTKANVIHQLINVDTHANWGIPTNANKIYILEQFGV